MCTENLSLVITEKWSRKSPGCQKHSSFAPQASYLQANWASIHTTNCIDMCCANVDMWKKNLWTYAWLWIETEWGASTILPVNWTNKLIVPEGKSWDLEIAKLSQLEQKKRKIMDL